MRWFMTLSYRGAAFHGWQIQPGQRTVQSVVEEALTTILRQPTAIVGAGRTDAGVNARTMVAHVDLPDDIDPRDARFMLSLNSMCGRDIAIHSFAAVRPDAHARFDATERAYRYYVHTAKDPFAGELSWYVPRGMDFEAMNRAAGLLLGRRDFTSFAKLHTDTRTNICELRRAAWHRVDDTHYYFELAADRFLRNMVRAVVGTLVEVGRDKQIPGYVLEVLASMDRCAAGNSVPGGALFLWDIQYPANVYI